MWQTSNKIFHCFYCKFTGDFETVNKHEKECEKFTLGASNPPIIKVKEKIDIKFGDTHKMNNSFCGYCSFKGNELAVIEHTRLSHDEKRDEYPKMMDQKEETDKDHENPIKASRFPTKTRYDILDPEFLEAMAKIGKHGADKYGDFNWTKSRLIGEKGPINHIFGHLKKYRISEQYDHLDVGTERKYHLAAIAFNAMMEYYYECHPELLP